MTNEELIRELDDKANNLATHAMKQHNSIDWPGAYATLALETRLQWFGAVLADQLESLAEQLNFVSNR
jgi:hypothetical protein